MPVPGQFRSVVEAWRRLCGDSSAEALIFPVFGRGERAVMAVPRSGKNFLKWRTVRCKQVGRSGPSYHLPGDTTDDGDRPATARTLERHSGDTAKREHKDEGRHVRSDGRTERSRGGELAYVRGARRLKDAGYRAGPEREKSERSEWNSAKSMGEVTVSL